MPFLWSTLLMGLSIVASDSPSRSKNLAGIFVSRRKSTRADCRRAPTERGGRLPMPSTASGQSLKSSSIRVITCRGRGGGKGVGPEVGAWGGGPAHLLENHWIILVVDDPVNDAPDAAAVDPALHIGPLERRDLVVAQLDPGPLIGQMLR